MLKATCEGRPTKQGGPGTLAGPFVVTYDAERAKKARPYRGNPNVNTEDSRILSPINSEVKTPQKTPPGLQKPRD